MTSVTFFKPEKSGKKRTLVLLNFSKDSERTEEISSKSSLFNLISYQTIVT